MIKQAVILAGGKGSRLLPLTRNLPKPMVKIINQPFLSYLILSLKKTGIEKILILVGYKSQKIVNFYKNFNEIKIEFNYSRVECDTGRRVLDAYDVLDKKFMLLYGDNYWTPNIKQMYKNFINKNASITTTVFKNIDGTGEYGIENNILTSENGLVKKYDKTRKDPKLNGVDIGFFLLRKSILNKFLKSKKNYSFENDILPKIIEKRKLYAFKTIKQYYSITDIQMVKKFEKIVKFKNLKHI